MNYLRDSLREQHPEDKLHILVTKRNVGNFTYDGIELGGERVAHEIEQELEDLEKQGHAIKKLSVIGYSLGGLISRYAIGLLYQSGLFERVEPVNFTTFATPHLGVRSPLKGIRNQLVNFLGARTLSMSGQQIFTIDEFRDTGRPLLAVLADPNSIFIQGLKSFKNRTLYANVVNDRSVPYHTASFSSIDPFVDPDVLDITYLDGYQPVILDPDHPVSKKLPVAKSPVTLSQRTKAIFEGLPQTGMFMLIMPIGISAFLVNAAIQSFRSTQRIRLHEEGKAGIDIKRYRVPLIGTIRREVGGMLERVGSASHPQYLPSGGFAAESDDEFEPTEETKADLKNDSEFPTLALTSEQFAMIDGLDKVGWEKYRVYIHKHRHAHAAIIYRRQGDSFKEGHVVVKHWLSKFEI